MYGHQGPSSTWTSSTFTTALGTALSTCCSLGGLILSTSEDIHVLCGGDADAFRLGSISRRARSHERRRTRALLASLSTPLPTHWPSRGRERETLSVARAGTPPEACTVLMTVRPSGEQRAFSRQHQQAGEWVI